MPRNKNPPSVKPNVYSYDIGAKPFVHDKDRGKWSSIWDFYLVSVGHTLSTNTLLVIPATWILYGGITGVISCLLNLIFFVVPILFTQSALGQFSSSGFISIFRIAPLFKGLGYMILILNLISVSYYSVIATYPLYFIFNSFSTELPWMTCNNTWNTDQCVLVEPEENLSNSSRFYVKTAPKEFFTNNLMRSEVSGETLSWPIIGCLLLVWILVGLYNSQGIKSIQKAFRYGVLVAGGLFLAIFLRFAALPGNDFSLNQYYKSFFSFESFASFAMSPVVGVALLGPGWGNSITISSFNKFKTNVAKYSYVIPLLGVAVLVISTIFLMFAFGYAKQFGISLDRYLDYTILSLPYYVIPLIIGTLEVPQMWSIIFFSILFIFQTNAVALQIFSICTSLFDEFENLRTFRRWYTIVLCVIMFLISIIYSCGIGIGIYLRLFEWSSISQMSICFMQLMVVVWVYGRLRFQRDVKFMTGKQFSNLKFFILRFVTPIITIVAVLISFLFHANYSDYFHSHYNYIVVIIIIIFVVIFVPWIFIPGYAIYKLYNATGTFCNRLKKSVRPHDWYPSEGDDRQRYEEELNSAVITHQLVEDNPETF